jgi:hypothetical protein
MFAANGVPYPPIRETSAPVMSSGVSAAGERGEDQPAHAGIPSEPTNSANVVGVVVSAVRPVWGGWRRG